MSEEGKSKIRLGLFVLAGSFFFILTLILIGRNKNIFRSSIELRTRFKNVNGLTSGSNIHFSGIQVGTVKRISMMNDTTLEVTMQIDDQMKVYIHKDAQASIGSEGLLGNKIINIMPTSGSAPSVEDGDLLASERTINTKDLFLTLDRTNSNVSIISEEIKNTIQRINSSKALWGILNEPSLADNLKSSLNNINQASADASKTAHDLHRVVMDVRSGNGIVGALISDTVLKSKLEQAIFKIELTGDKAAGLADNLDRIAGSIEKNSQSGTGLLHTLMYDTEIVKKLNTSLDNIQKGTNAFSEDMEALKHNFLFRGYFRKLEKEQKDSIK